MKCKCGFEKTELNKANHIYCDFIPPETTKLIYKQAERIKELEEQLKNDCPLSTDGTCQDLPDLERRIKELEKVLKISTDQFEELEKHVSELNEDYRSVILALEAKLSSAEKVVDAAEKFLTDTTDDIYWLDLADAIKQHKNQ